jgi:D-alanine-D-alanine ligase
VSGRVRVGLLFGGSSVEHEVSVVSARGVAKALDPDRFETFPLAIATDGQWLAPIDSKRLLEGDAKTVRSGVARGGRLVIDPGVTGGLIHLGSTGGSLPVAIDVVFSVVHGWGGEDGRIQGLLDLAGIPYVGAGVLGSAVGMDKQVAKALFQERGLPVGPWRSIRRGEWDADRAGAERRLVDALKLPVFVKPANGGSSVGISKVKAAADLGNALEIAFALDAKVVVEAGLPVREIECAVLGNESPEASVLGEIVPSGEFYDYAAKYEDGTSGLLIPAPVPAGVAQKIRAYAIEAFQALDLSGMARVDFFLEKQTDRVFVNEVNTLPGFTPISMYPKLWEATGLTYRGLLTRLIDLARERFDIERNRATVREV